MAILFADDFKGYGTNPAFLLNGLYAQAGVGLVTDPDTNASGVVMQAQINGINGTALRRVFPSNYTTAGAAFRLWLAALPITTAQTPAFLFSDASNVEQFYISITTTGAMQVRLGAAYGTVLATTSGPVLVANAWNHIEFKAVASATVGTIEIRVNGVPVAVFTTLNTGTQYSQFRIDKPNSVGATLDFYVKDLVVWNSTGSSNNNFLGTVSVVGMTPSSDISLNWTPSTGTTGWNLLDNSPPLDGTEYITAPFPAPSPASFNLTDLPANVTSVRAMITQVRARKVDGGDGNIQASLLSGAATANGADRPITTAFTYYEDVFEVDPNTSAAWTPSAANAARLKINRTV
jgi:hypothetical protein